MAQMAKDDVTTLETDFVDRYDMQTVLETLAQIAAEKADHLRSDWQDWLAARDWNEAARRIEKLATKVNV